jgi:tRNA(Ile)-lysidine synthase
VTDLPQRVEKNLLSRRLLKRGQAVLVAVSGGLDSMALLHTLHELASRHRWQLTVAHFNHRLRGRSSDADERLVCRAAAALKLPVMVERADVKGFAQKSKLSIEMAARKLRHEFFARTARARGIRAIALAHHADDQVELFFLRVLRGAGGEGLAGMKWRSPSPADPRIMLLRPLLDTAKEELRRFAGRGKIRFREDATNAQLEMPRNRVRNELLPLLRRRYQPALAKAVLRLMEIVGAEAEAVGRMTGRWLKERRPAFAGLPAALQRRVLQRQLGNLGLVADFDLVEQLRESANVQVSVGPGLFVLRDPAGSVVLRRESPMAFNPRQTALKLAGRAGSLQFGGLCLDWRLEAGSNFVRSLGQKAREFFDADRVGGNITLRHWRPGDRFQPIGLQSASKLQDLFTNRKIPVARRRDLVVAATGNGEIFWVEELRMGERFKLTPQTRRRLVWRWRSLAGRTEMGGKP